MRVTGSDTMLVLNRRLAESYMRVHPGVAIVVAGGGTAVGVESLVAGRCQIGAASRPLLAEEVQALHDSFGTLGLRYLVAQDALSVYLHPSNPVRDLALVDLGRLFDGSVRSWSEVGGDEVPVSVVLRPPSSGTYRFFRDHVLAGRAYAAEAQTVASTRDVVAAVGARPGAIGYGGVAYGAEVAHCAIDGVPPTAENVRDGSYPLARYLHFVTVEPPRGEVRRFIDWCLGPQGQQIVAEVGYIPLWER